MSSPDAILSALTRYGLKQAGRNKYRSNSPLRNDSDSGAFALTIDDAYGGGGKYFDHVTGEGGNFITLAQALGLTPASAPAHGQRAALPTSTKRAYTGLAAYAQHQGVPADVLERWGWREGHFYCPRHRGERPALIFPTATGDRARFTDGLEPRYMSPKEYQRCWYGLKRAVTLATSTGRPLVICNGEASTIVAQHYGVPAVAITGGGEQGIPSDLVDELLAASQGPILIALDSDDTGRRGAAKMRATLTAAGYGARAVDLNGPKGFDLANFAKLHGEGTTTALADLDDLPDAGDMAVNAAEIERLREIIVTQQHVISQQRAQLDELAEGTAWQANVLKHPALPPSDKIFMLAARSPLVVGQDMAERQGRAAAPVNYGHLAALIGMSKTTIGNVVDRQEEAGAVRKDPTTRTTRAGYDVTEMNLQLLPAFFNIDQLTVPPRKHGGARPGAGRRPKCKTCPPGTKQLEKKTTIVEIYCTGCGDLLDTHEDMQKRIVEADDDAAPAETPRFNQDETGEQHLYIPFHLEKSAAPEDAPARPAPQATVIRPDLYRRYARMKAP